jgi:hypothetical protein
MSYELESKSYRRKELLLPKNALLALKPYLDFANLLDPARELPAPHLLPDGGLGGPLSEELSTAVRKNGQFAVPPEISSKMKRGRGRIIGWIKDDSAPEGGWRLDLLSLYEVFYAIRELARGVADAFLLRKDKTESVPSISIPLKGRVLKVREDGTLKQRGDVFEGFLALLQRVDAGRIARCPIPKCGKLYYKWRADKGACSEKCCTILNTENSRAPEKAAKYKENRIRAAERREKIGFKSQAWT